MIPRVVLVALGAAAVVATAGGAHAQAASEWVSRGTAAYAARNAPEALADFEKALAIEPRLYDALWNAARAGVEVGEFDPSEAERTALYNAAADRARLATQ